MRSRAPWPCGLMRQNMIGRMAVRISVSAYSSEKKKVKGAPGNLHKLQESTKDKAYLKVREGEKLSETQCT